MVKSSDSLADTPKAVTNRSITMTRRLVAALALLPIVPAAAIVATRLSASRLAIASFDEYRWYNFWLAILWVGLTVLVWRKMILWTLGRAWLTALLGFVPFVQVIYAQPLWNAGCVSDDFLRIGQGNVGIGVWVWLSVWVWWGWEKRFARRASTKQTNDSEEKSMSSTAKRIVCAIGSIPVVFGFFLITAIALESAGWSGYQNAAAAFGVAATLACVIWCAIWRGAVQWSGATKLRTLGLAVVCMGIPIVACFFLLDQGFGFWSDVSGAFPVIGWGIWMIVTLRSWPMLTPAVPDGARTPSCMQCGYLLTGLTATRCPECGNEPTIDELWRANAGDAV